MRARTRAALALAVTAALGACQPPAPPPGPPPPARTTTSLGLEAAHATLAERLLAQGFRVERSPGGLTATSTDARFTACAAIRMGELGRNDTRSRPARADRATATAVIRLEAAGARTRLSWRTDFSGSYLNRFDNRRIEAPCRGTGALEHLLETILPD